MKKDAVARRMASQQWGKVVSQKKIAEGVWLFQTEGHGGYIVDTSIHTMADKGDIVYINANSSMYRPGEQIFASYEEDCEYAKFEWLYPGVLYELYEKMSKQKEIAQPRSRWVLERLKRNRELLSGYYPEFLKQYPKEGMGR